MTLKAGAICVSLFLQVEILKKSQKLTLKSETSILSTQCLPIQIDHNLNLWQIVYSLVNIKQSEERMKDSKNTNTSYGKNLSYEELVKLAEDRSFIWSFPHITPAQEEAVKRKSEGEDSEFAYINA